MISIHLAFHDFNNEFQVPSGSSCQRFWDAACKQQRTCFSNVQSVQSIVHSLHPIPPFEKHPEHWNGRLSSVRALLFFTGKPWSTWHDRSFLTLRVSLVQADLVSSFQMVQKDAHKIRCQNTTHDTSWYQYVNWVLPKHCDGWWRLIAFPSEKSTDYLLTVTRFWQANK